MSFCYVLLFVCYYDFLYVRWGWIESRLGRGEVKVGVGPSPPPGLGVLESLDINLTSRNRRLSWKERRRRGSRLLTWSFLQKFVVQVVTGLHMKTLERSSKQNLQKDGTQINGIVVGLFETDLLSKEHITRTFWNSTYLLKTTKSGFSGYKKGRDNQGPYINIVNIV